MRTVKTAAVVTGTLLTIASMPRGANAETQSPNLEQLVAKSAAIVSGQVTTVSSHPITRPGPSGQVTVNMYSEITITGQVLKGEPNVDKVTFRILGGHDPRENMWYEVKDAPTFEQGERVVVFLKPGYANGEQLVSPVVGWMQGKFSVSAVDGQDRVVAAGGPVTQDTFRAGPTLSVFEANIQAAIATSANFPVTADSTSQEIHPVFGSPPVAEPSDIKE